MLCSAEPFVGLGREELWQGVSATLTFPPASEQSFGTENVFLRLHTLALLRSRGINGVLSSGRERKAIKLGSFMEHLWLSRCPDAVWSRAGSDAGHRRSCRTRQRVSRVSLLVRGNWRIQDIPTPAIPYLGRRSGVAMLENVHFWVKSRRYCRSFFVIRHLKEYCKTFTPVYKVFAED